MKSWTFPGQQATYVNDRRVAGVTTPTGRPVLGSELFTRRAAATATSPEPIACRDQRHDAPRNCIFVFGADATLARSVAKAERRRREALPGSALIGRPAGGGQTKAGKRDCACRLTSAE